MKDFIMIKQSINQCYVSRETINYFHVRIGKAQIHTHLRKSKNRSLCKIKYLKPTKCVQCKYIKNNLMYTV